MFLRCWDREPRMMSREHWGESLPESVQVIEEQKRTRGDDLIRWSSKKNLLCRLCKRTTKRENLSPKPGQIRDLILTSQINGNKN